MSTLAGRLVRWQARHGRRDLPWQRTRDPYRIWLSEVMLQQTQVATVIPYYERFLARFPDVESLAGAELDDVLALWSGLGYYSRARNLHAAAQVLVESRRGRFPRTREGLALLPGLGRSTAAAIAVFAFGEREAILDGNVKRVLARHFAVRGYPGEKRIEDRLWKLAESQLPRKNIERYTQALMDLGSGLCTRTQPACASCPLKATCKARARGKVKAYPQPRPRRTLPERKTSMLLLRFWKSARRWAFGEACGACRRCLRAPIRAIIAAVVSERSLRAPGACRLCGTVSPISLCISRLWFVTWTCRRAASRSRGRSGCLLKKRRRLPSRRR